MATTIRDVAMAAGVSAMAVSKVLHGKGANVRVSVETANNIRRVADELRYQPNRLARSFRQQKTHTIGLVFEHIGRIGELDGYFSQFLNGVMRATFQSEYSLTICPKLVKLSENGVLNDGRFDGLLWCKPEHSLPSMESIERSELPIVLMHAPEGAGPNIPRFCCNNELGLRLAVDHLVTLGHRKIAFVVDEVNRRTAEGWARVEGFRAAMTANRLDITAEDILGWQIEQPLLEGRLDHTALITFSEKQAAYILHQAEKVGMSIPADLSVVGFDSTAYCDTTRPRLTAISQPIERMAFDAINVLIACIEQGRSAPKAYTYDCGFDVRESTAKPARTLPA